MFLRSAAERIHSLEKQRKDDAKVYFILFFLTIITTVISSIVGK